MADFELSAGSPVVLYLRDPKEKIWGLLLSMTTAGIAVRGIDLTVFDDWMRQEARKEEVLLGLLTLFYPMHRVERLERDESVGPHHELRRPVRERSGSHGRRGRAGPLQRRELTTAPRRRTPP